jgi:hypothetical protein
MACPQEQGSRCASQHQPRAGQRCWERDRLVLLFVPAAHRTYSRCLSERSQPRRSLSRLCNTHDSFLETMVCDEWNRCAVCRLAPADDRELAILATMDTDAAHGSASRVSSFEA